jgi:hypothetical protein
MVRHVPERQAVHGLALVGAKRPPWIEIALSDWVF